MTQSDTLVSVDEYLNTSYRPDVDYVDGHLVQRNLGDFRHSFLQSGISAYFNATLQDRYGEKFWAFSEFRTEIRARTRYRIPDILVLPFGVAQDVKYLNVAPWIAIEIISPEDRTLDLLTRCREYVDRGTPYVWMIDPKKRSVTEIDAKGSRLRKDRMFDVELAGETFRVDLNEVFVKMDRYLQGLGFSKS